MIFFGWFRRKKKLTDEEYAAKLKAARDRKAACGFFEAGPLLPHGDGRTYRCMGCGCGPERYPMCDQCAGLELKTRAALRQTHCVTLPAGTTVEEPASSKLAWIPPLGLSISSDDGPASPPGEPSPEPFDGGGGSFSGGGATGGWEPAADMPCAAPDPQPDTPESPPCDSGSSDSSSSDCGSGGSSE